MAPICCATDRAWRSAHRCRRARRHRLRPSPLAAEPPADDPAAGRASTLSLSPGSARIVLFGMRCTFSYHVLDALLAAGRTIVGLILPGPPGAAVPIHFHPPTTRLPLVQQPA